MRNRLSVFIRTCCLLASAFLPLFAFADDFPPKPSPPRLVNDFAHVLSADELVLLEQKLKAFSDTTSNEVAIVTIGSIGSYEVADYTLKLFNRWGVGGNKHNNGVLVLVAVQEHRMNITTGKGLEGALPDITAGQIIDNEMRPAFRANNYYQGLDRATTAIMAATRGEYKVDKKQAPNGGIGAGAIVMIIVIVIIILTMRGGGGRGGGRYLSRGGAGDFGGGFILGSLLNGGFGGGSNSGGGGFGGGGFGGFGGGSSGGGGASGSW